MSSANEQRNSIISTYFTKVSTLIRNSTPTASTTTNGSGSSSISDTIKLQLYGYYKVATTATNSNNSQGEEEKVPSIFNVVGRAKYNAIQSAKQHCTTLSTSTLSSDNNKEEIVIDKYKAMKCYLEVAASCYNKDCEVEENEVEDDENNVGKVCYELYNEMINKLDNCDNNDDKKKGETLESSSTDVVKKKEPSQPPATTATSYSQQSTTQPINLLQSLKLSYRLPIYPLIPRGQIDITFYHLFITLLKCIICIIYNILSINSILFGIFVGRFNPNGWSRWYETRIGKRWLTLISEDSSMSDATTVQQQQQQPKVITGLSIRSLLDLYLLTKSYPNGSEVIIAPSVSIPGMVTIMKYHGIKLVTVDLLSKSGAATEGEVEERVEGEVEDNGKKLEETRWGINISQLKQSITKQTVSILIVHPFGTIIGNSNIMKQVRDIVNDTNNNSNEEERDIEIWEDCAQCYGMPSPEGEEGKRGKRGLYTGSVYANISFFSFGTIKTSTALGGGLAIIRTVPSTTPSSSSSTTSNNNDKISTTIKEKSIQNTIQSMKRIQDTMYKQQSHSSYLLKVIKCMLLHVISKSHLLCGFIKYLIEKIGFNYDMVVVSLLRGFKVSTSSDNDNEYGSGRNELIQQIRHRPCMALLSLLYTRLVNSDKTQKHVHQRLQQYQSFAKRLLKNTNVAHNNISLLKNTNGEENMYGWVFPILVNSQQHTSKMLLKCGYDVPCGMTQLQPVVTTQGEDGVNNCPRVRNVFDHILYLPVSNLNSVNDQQRLIDALVHVTSSSTTEEVTSHDARLTPTRQQRPLVLRKGVIISLGIFEWYFSIFGMFHFVPFRSILRLAVVIGPWISSAFVMTLLLLLVLCHYMGPIYLESSNTFAKYCGMIFKSPFERSREGGSNPWILICRGWGVMTLPL